MPVAHDGARVDAEDRRRAPVARQPSSRVLAGARSAAARASIAGASAGSRPTDGADSGEAATASAPSP